MLTAAGKPGAIRTRSLKRHVLCGTRVAAGFLPLSVFSCSTVRTLEGEANTPSWASAGQGHVCFCLVTRVLTSSRIFSFTIQAGTRKHVRMERLVFHPWHSGRVEETGINKI